MSDPAKPADDGQVVDLAPYYGDVRCWLCKSIATWRVVFIEYGTPKNRKPLRSHTTKLLCDVHGSLSIEQIKAVKMLQELGT